MPRPRGTIIGRYQNDLNRSDFLQMEDRVGGAIFGGIDPDGFRYGTLAAGDFSGVTLKITSYQVLEADNGQLISVNSASPSTITLPATAPDSPWWVQIQNVGAGSVTVAATPNIDGSANDISLSQNQGIIIGSDGTSYYTQRGVGGSGGSGFSGVSAQTDNYTAQSTDTGKLLTFSKATAVTLTLPASAPGSTWFVYVQNRGVGFLTINRNGLNIDSAAQNIGLLQNQGLLIFCDGSNYFTDRGVSGIGNVNSQTGDYAPLVGDSGKLIVMNKASAVALTMPASPPAASWFILVQNIGAGDLTINRNGLTIDGVAANLTLVQNQGVVLFTDGVNYFTERGSGSTAANVAIKPATDLGIQFISADGNDANDGLSMGSAKLTIMAGYDALPSSGGTVFIIGQGVDGTKWPHATSTSGQGIWIMGPTDPNYASPPAGWRKAKNSGLVQVAFIGIPSSIAGQNDMAGNNAGFIGGDDTRPAIWLSGVTGVTFRNLATQYPKSLAWLAVNSNGNKNGAAGGSDIIFDNCEANVNFGGAGYGPVVDIGPNLFWVRFSNCGFQCNNVAAESSDNRCAILCKEGSAPVATITAVALTSNVATITAANEMTAGGGVRVTVAGTATAAGAFNGSFEILSATPTQFTYALTHANVGTTADTGTATPGINPAMGIIYFENCHFTGGGGIRYYNQHEGTGGFFIKNSEMEGTSDSQPIFEVMTSVGTYRATLIFSEGLSDSGNGAPRVRVAPGNINWSTTVLGLGGFNNIDFVGPMTLIGQSGLSSISTGYATVGGIPIGITNPQAQGQKGSVFAKALDQVDAHRRHFLAYPRFTNLATQLPATWVAVGAGTITTGQDAPDGTTNAGLVGGADATLDGARCFETSRTYNAGDYIYFGVWVRSKTPQIDSVTSASPGAYFVFGNPGLTPRLLCGSFGALQLSESLLLPACVQDDGGWQWVWGVLKCTTGNAVSYGVRCFLPAQTGHSVYYYAPVFCHITAAQVQTLATTTVDTVGNSGATQSGNIVTIKTTAAHGLVPGMVICIKGVTAGGYNGEFVVKTTPSTTTFTYYNTTTGLGTSGSGSVIPGNDSEVSDWALQMSAYSDNLTAGPGVATPRGVPFSFGGTGDNFHAKFNHTALTQNRTITVPDGDGDIILANAANVFSAAQRFDAGLRIGAGGTLLTQAVVYTPTLTPAAVSANAVEEQDFAVSGLTTADIVILNQPTPTANVGIAGWRVKTNNVLSIQFVNPSGSPVTPASGVYPIIAFRR